MNEALVRRWKPAELVAEHVLLDECVERARLDVAAAATDVVVSSVFACALPQANQNKFLSQLGRRPTTYEMVSQTCLPLPPARSAEMGGCRGAGPPAKVLSPVSAILALPADTHYKDLLTLVLR